MKKVLADFTKEYFNADNHTHKEIPFDVPEGLKEIRIKIAYSPKEFDDETASLAIVREVRKRRLVRAVRGEGLKILSAS